MFSNKKEYSIEDDKDLFRYEDGSFIGKSVKIGSSIKEDNKKIIKEDKNQKDSIISKIKNIFNTIKEKLVDIFSFLGDKIKDIIDAIKNIFSKDKVKVKDKITLGKEDIISRILSICIVVVIVFGILSITDIILVTRFNTTPIFAILTRDYKDGGSRGYIGIGYKVIDYNIKGGRCDMVIGGWTLKYDNTANKTSIKDISDSYNNDLKYFADNYLNHYLEISGEIDNIEIICDNNIKFKNNDKVKLVGTLYDYSYDDGLKIYMKGCYLK